MIEAFGKTPDNLPERFLTGAVLGVKDLSVPLCLFPVNLPCLKGRPMKARELKNLGVPKGKAMQAAIQAVKTVATSGMRQPEMRAKKSRRSSMRLLISQATKPGGRWRTELFNLFEAQARYVGREEAAPWRQWGEGLEAGAVEQMANACKLPVTVTGALMPDAHLGYGLPIGGVLATKNCVIPYAVGVDIACRMKMTVLDMPVTALDKKADTLQGGDPARNSFRHRREL